MPCTTSGSKSFPTIPSRGAAPSVTVATLWTVIGAPFVRLLAQGQALPPHVLVAVRNRGVQLGEGQVLALEPVWIDFHVVLLDLAAEAHHVDDPGDLLDLLLQDPVLGRLQFGERVAGSA